MISFRAALSDSAGTSDNGTLADRICELVEVAVGGGVPCELGRMGSIS
jgi:hypothetical protein